MGSGPTGPFAGFQSAWVARVSTRGSLQPSLWISHSSIGRGDQTVVIFYAAIIFDGVDKIAQDFDSTIMKEWGVARAAFSPVVSARLLRHDDWRRRPASPTGSAAARPSSTASRSPARYRRGAPHGAGRARRPRLLAGIGLGDCHAQRRDARRRNACAQTPAPPSITIVCMPLGYTRRPPRHTRCPPGWRMLFIAGGVVPSSPPLCTDDAGITAVLARHPAVGRNWRLLRHARARMTTRVCRPEEHAATRARPRHLLFLRIRRDTFALWGSLLLLSARGLSQFSWLPSLWRARNSVRHHASTGSRRSTSAGRGAMAGASPSRPVPRCDRPRACRRPPHEHDELSPGCVPDTDSRHANVHQRLINAVQATMYALATGNIRARASDGSSTAVGGRLGAILRLCRPWASYRGSEFVLVLRGDGDVLAGDRDRAPCRGAVSEYRALADFHALADAISSLVHQAIASRWKTSPSHSVCGRTRNLRQRIFATSHSST